MTEKKNSKTTSNHGPKVSTLGEALIAAINDPSVPADDRPLGWKLQDLALDYKGTAGASGDPYERTVAVVLAALEWLPHHPTDPALRELETAAERFFGRNPDWHPFTPTAAAGADLLLETLRSARAKGFPNGQIAVCVIGAAPTSRPGLPAIARHDGLPPGEQNTYAVELRGKLEKALEKVENRGLDAEDWCEAALRAVLRVLEDPNPDNALKHKHRKKRNR